MTSLPDFLTEHRNAPSAELKAQFGNAFLLVNRASDTSRCIDDTSTMMLAAGASKPLFPNPVP